MYNQDALPVTTFFHPSSASAFIQKHEQVFSIAVTLLKEKQINIVEKYSEIIEDEEMCWMSCSIELEDSLEEIADLNFELALRLADLPSKALENVVIKYIKVKQEKNNVTSE